MSGVSTTKAYETDGLEDRFPHRTRAGVALGAILRDTVALSITTEFREARNRVDFILFHPDSQVPKETISWTYEALIRAFDVAATTADLVRDLPSAWKASHVR